MSQKNKEYNTEKFSNRLKRIISSDSDDKEESMYSIVRELEEKENEGIKKQSGRKNIVFLLFALIVFSLAVNLLLFDRNEALSNKIETLEYRDSLFIQFMEPDSASIITYRVKNGNPVTYHQLEAEKDSLQSLYNDMEGLKEHYRIKLGLATRNYPISFTKEGNVYTIHAPKLDSALLLLPVYRDMIEFDKEARTWTVTKINYR